MIKIAICDDEKSFIEELTKGIYGIESCFEETVEIATYISGKLLCDELQSGVYYDLIFLDIIMPDLDGIDVGEIIRNQQHNNITQIVYVSSESKYAMDLFKIRPMDFLIKPVEQHRIEAVLRMAVELINHGRQMFTYTYNKELYRELVNNIYYFESSARKLFIHTTNGICEFYGRLEEVYESLERSDFIFIHKSYLVNYNYVKSIKADYVTMENGEQLPISRNRKEEIRKICSTRFF